MREFCTSLITQTPLIMEKVILAIAFALAVLVGTTTNSSPNEKQIEKENYKPPVYG